MKVVLFLLFKVIYYTVKVTDNINNISYLKLFVDILGPKIEYKRYVNKVIGYSSNR